MKKFLLFSLCSMLYALCFFPCNSYSYFKPKKPIKSSKLSPFSDSMRPLRKSPTLKQIEVFSKFNARYSRNWNVRYNPRTALPEAIVGGKTFRYTGTPHEISVNFLKENTELLQVDVSQLILMLSKTHLGVTHLQYQQIYNNIPVEFSYVRLHINENGEVIGYQSRFEPEIKVPLIPAISEFQAQSIVSSDMGMSAVRKPILVLYPDENDGKMHLAWKIKTHGSRINHGKWIYYIDAHSGQILYKYDDLRRACSFPYNAAEGTVTGKVYGISPKPTGDARLNVEVTWEPSVSKAMKNQYVWVQSYASSVTTSGSGEYCSNNPGKIFASLKGPYFSVVNFKGKSAHYDNGIGSWNNTWSQYIATPKPYENNQTYTYQVSITPVPSYFAKASPRFTSFNVGQMNEYGDFVDNDMVDILDSANNIVGTYIGKRTQTFNGASVENPNMTIRLTTNESGTNDGFTIDGFEYLVLTNAPGTSVNPTNFIWSTNTYVSGSLMIPDNTLDEVNVFYHLNQVHDFFDNSLNKDTRGLGTKPININTQSQVMVHVSPEGETMYNAFFDDESGGIYYGDGPMDVQYRYRSFALDGTVVRHEYGHLVISKIYPTVYGGEFGAIEEALADYFSLASFKSEGTDIDILGNFIGAGEGSTRCLNDWSGGSPCGSSTRRRMPTNWWGEVHEDSLIISQALWDLKKGPNALGDVTSITYPTYNGVPRADVFTFASLFYFPDTFANFYDAMLMVCSQIEGSDCLPGSAMRTNITTAFGNHGIAGAVSGDIYESNNGPEWATDISTINPVSATIDPAGDVDFYSVPLARGHFTAKLTLPSGSQYATYHAYGIYFFDANRKQLAGVEPEVYNYDREDGGCPDDGECLTLSSEVILDYDITESGRYYIVIAAGSNAYGGNCRDNSTSPYQLILDYTSKGSGSAQIVTASYDNDEIEFTVPYTKFPMEYAPSSTTMTGAEVVFEYAQLRDHNFQPIELAKTGAGGSYLEFVSAEYTTDVVGRRIMKGRVRLKTGFAARYPGVGTVYLEIYGRNHLDRVVSLGVSNTINLTTNKSDAVTYNNIISPSNSSAIIKYDLLSEGTLSVKIYTLSGSLVKTVFDGNISAGKGTTDWDGTNDSGQRVASGIYFVKIKGPGVDVVEKIAVVR